MFAGDVPGRQMDNAMRKATWWMAMGLALALPTAQAGDSLRVGNRVLVTGDSAATVSALLGKPSYKAHARATTSRSRSRKRRNTRAASANQAPGERWQYRRHGRVIVVTLVDGRVADIDEYVP